MRKGLAIFVYISIVVAVMTSFLLLREQIVLDKPQAKFTALRLATIYRETHPNAQTIRTFADLVREKSSDQLTLELFCDRKLGDAPQLLEQLSFGGIALAVVDSITLCQQIPQLSEILRVAPGLEPAQVQQELVARQEEISALLQQEQVDLLAIYMPDYHVIATATHAVQTPTDLAGLRLYKPSRSAVEDGAQRVQVEWGDLPQSIANDFADGGEMTLLEYFDDDYQLVMPYMTAQSVIYSVDFLLVSEVSMGLLEPEMQHMTRELAQETLVLQKDLLLQAQRQTLNKQLENQVRIYPPKLLEVDAAEWVSLLADYPWLWKGGVG